jgi:hypothetical protein
LGLNPATDIHAAHERLLTIQVDERLVYLSDGLKNVNLVDELNSVNRAASRGSRMNELSRVEEKRGWTAL